MEKIENKEKKSYEFFKPQYPNRLILFEVGDFYEAYEDDAVEISRILDIHLASKPNIGLEHFCGFPRCHIDKYLPILIKNSKGVVMIATLEKVYENKD